MANRIDVLCVGHASYDLVFSVEHHPGPDEKSTATIFAGCGGGPAANAAVTVSRLGYQAAFSGYLGNDYYGRMHLQELVDEGVITDFVVRGNLPTPLSVILVKPDGRRSVVNYKGKLRPIAKAGSDLLKYRPKVMLFDGHEPDLSAALISVARAHQIATVLDAGSVHQGTRELVAQVDYVVASEGFGMDFTGEQDLQKALKKLNKFAPSVVITRGESGLIWKNKEETGRLGAFPVEVVDTTGAGDAFHGAFAAGLATGKSWLELLRYASAVAAMSCTQYGARLAIPEAQEVLRFISEKKPVDCG